MCEGDADTEIVNATIISALQDEVTVFADDTDILILLLHFMNITKDLKNIYLESIDKTYEMLTTINNTPLDILGSLLLCHAVTGCDTTSSLYLKGKINTIKKRFVLNLTDTAPVFYSAQSSTGDVIEAGEQLMIGLYQIAALRGHIQKAFMS